MHLERLQLYDYRNFVRTDLALRTGLSLFLGDNAQGKSNLLEAVHLLATMRAVWAEADLNLVRRELQTEPASAARVVGEAVTAAGSIKLEVAIGARPGAHGPVAHKTVRVNGVPRRTSDAVGKLTAVLFSADDLEMIGGAPSLRRRNLDLTLAQLDSKYSVARSHYERVLLQRNNLLKRIRDSQASRKELEFWDEELCKDGGVILQRRASTLIELGELVCAIHSSLAAGEEATLAYLPKIGDHASDLATSSGVEAGEIMAIALRQGMSRDIAAGMTLTGPHRDDVVFSLNGHSASAYASRAQQRTIALSLRLAEAELLKRHRGEWPVLLLDDVLSEMDAVRRSSVLAAIGDVDQMLVTGTDRDRFPSDLISGASVYTIHDGAATPA